MTQDLILAHAADKAEVAEASPGPGDPSVPGKDLHSDGKHWAVKCFEECYKPKPCTAFKKPIGKAQ